MPDTISEITRFPESDPGPEPIHVGIACPTAYSVAIASLGYQIVHLIAQSHPGVVTHRIVLDKPDGKSYPTKTLEEKLDIKSLDAIFFSCSFENDYIHLVRMLDTAGIPVLRRDRGSLPLILIGGIAPTGNPEPLANIADAILIGAGEINVPAALDGIQDFIPLLKGARFKSGRDQLYELWDTKVGIYVPELWSDKKVNFKLRDERKVSQAYVDVLDDFPSYTPVISSRGVYGSKNLIEISRGCPAHCNFCMLSYVNRKGQERSVGNILENARKYSPDEASIGLISSRVGDHPGIVDVVNALADDGYNVSVSSLRVATSTDELLQALSRAGTKSVAFAPEHGSEKILKLINKLYSYDDVLGRINASFDVGINRIKLYFLTGFEEETDNDLSMMVDYIKALISDSGLMTRSGGEKLIIGLAPFVPKASTPFQRRPMQPERILKSKIKFVTGPFKNAPRIEIETESPRSSILQGIFSVGNRELTKHLAFVSRTRGPVISSWDEAVGVAGDSPVRLLMESRTTGAVLPWSFIER